MYASDELKADKNAVFAAMMQDNSALYSASRELQSKGLLILRGHVQSLALAHDYFMFFLLASRHYRHPKLSESNEQALQPSAANEGCVLNRLNAHGPHFAVHFKRMISEFLGVPTGHAWVLLCLATSTRFDQAEAALEEIENLVCADREVAEAEGLGPGNF